MWKISVKATTAIMAAVRSLEVISNKLYTQAVSNTVRHNKWIRHHDMARPQFADEVTGRTRTYDAYSESKYRFAVKKTPE